jgi:hypothetical protein
MKEYTRRHPEFSLCGLNCALCPRYTTEGSSKCPGCGGENFYEKHPSCKVINCSLKHGEFSFCFDCDEYPCDRYASIGEKDSFISYRHVKGNLEKAKRDLPGYLEELKERKEILEKLIDFYNDGKSKGFYCIAANNLEMASLRKSMKEIQAIDPGEDKKAIAQEARAILEKYAKADGVGLELRK